MPNIIVHNLSYHMCRPASKLEVKRQKDLTLPMMTFAKLKFMRYVCVYIPTIAIILDNL